MYFSNRDIRDSIIKKEIDVIPKVKEDDIECSGIKLHLDNKAIKYKENQIIDINNIDEIESEIVEFEDSIVLLPGEFMLFSSQEKIKMSKGMLGFIEGRSTLARLGISIHCTSGLIDNMFDEHRSIVFEIYNCSSNRIVLYNGMHICTILFTALKSTIEGAASQQYAGQRSVTGPVMV